MKKLFFTSEGRISRGQYWRAMLIFAGIALGIQAVGWLVYALFPTSIWWNGEANAPTILATVGMIVAVPLSLGCVVLLAWSGICLNVKRCHDRGRSGWFQLVQLIPMVGPLWWLIEAALLRGTTGPNPFGADPLKTHAPIVPLAVAA
jgi:uncharacterized membrane protein YhaH (DUF805 family)